MSARVALVSGVVPMVGMIAVLLRKSWATVIPAISIVSPLSVMYPPDHRSQTAMGFVVDEALHEVCLRRFRPSR